MKTNKHAWSYLNRFFLEWEIFQTKLVEEEKNTHFVLSIFFLKSCRLWDSVENFSRGGEAIVDNIAPAHCMLDT
jgi:hypothetical protein